MKAYVHPAPSPPGSVRLYATSDRTPSKTGRFGVAAPFAAEGVADLPKGGLGAGGVQHRGDHVLVGTGGLDHLGERFVHGGLITVGSAVGQHLFLIPLDLVA